MIHRAFATTARGAHAVVLGGSMAGMLAARVLADSFARVTVVDRDRLPLTPMARAGVPQARHLHHLLASGRATIERLFPGIEADLHAAGAIDADIVGDVAWLSPRGWVPRHPTGLMTYLCGRDVLESCVRRRLVALPQVQLLERHAADELIAEHGRVVGVRLAPRDGGEPMLLHADLVVDASGRTSHAPEWLAALGCRVPLPSEVSAFLGYASRSYALPTSDIPPFKVLLIQSRPPHNGRTGTLTLQEHGRWIVTLAGAARDYPPTDEDGFLAFARSLPDPTLARTMEQATPLGPIVGFRRSANRLQHYERCRSWPERFVVLGDAACALNPYYAQGMTNATRGALTLAAALDSDWRRTGWSHRFQRRLAATNRLPWLLATGEDFRYPATQGQRPALTRLLHWYVDRTMAAAHHPLVTATLVQVMHMLKPPQSLLHPRVALRVAGL
jgi:2-polyprenyl-6-methoxyphenol hydroxylase-like FAD-dependent oxidoreductase